MQVVEQYSDNEVNEHTYIQDVFNFKLNMLTWNFMLSTKVVS